MSDRRRPEERFKGVRVLIVEDHDDSREMVCELMRAVGAECEVAADVATARTKLSNPSWTPDIVISDIGLPDEDGYALSRWVRERFSPPPGPPVIAVTATSDRSATKSAGFVAHIIKPVEPSVLFDAIDEVLSSRRPSEP